MNHTKQIVLLSLIAGLCFSACLRMTDLYPEKKPLNTISIILIALVLAVVYLAEVLRSKR